MIKHRPGQWPVAEPADLDRVSAAVDTPDADELYMQRAAERARREIVLGSIRAHLEEQPTASSVLAVARHWLGDVVAIGDEVAKAKRSTA